MSRVMAKHIVEVNAIATETTLESAARTMSDGTVLAMNSHGRLGFTLDEYLRRYELIVEEMKQRR